MGMSRPNIIDMARRFTAFRAAQIGDSTVLVSTPATSVAPSKETTMTKASKPKKAAKTPTPKKTAPKKTVNRRAQIITMLEKASGTTVEEVCAKTGMLPHSARSLISTIGKEFTVKKTKDGGKPTVYSIAAAKPKKAQSADVAA